MLSRACAAAVLAAGVAALAAQGPPSQPPTAQTPPAATPPQQDQPRPTFRTEANFVRVDVYPTAGDKPVANLSRDDFEVLEDGRPQAIETFEYVRIAPAGPAAARRSDPNTIEAMRQAAADPRSRVFVIFLDALHVTRDGAKNIGPPLIRFIDRLLGPDDLVGIMTPWMSPTDVTLQRKTSVMESGLREAAWGKRFTMEEDAREAMYKSCYRLLYQEQQQGKRVSDVAKVLTVRRREALTLDALRDLVVYLRGIREERKAILAVTEGWMLFRPDAQITRLREECSCPRDRAATCRTAAAAPLIRRLKGWKESVPGGEPITIGPGGRLRQGSVRTESGDVSLNECNADRMRLASIDHAQFLNDLIQDANRANATFYTIDPRGLAVFDTPIHRDADEVGLPLNVIEDMSSMRQRHDAMANLASGTDGTALMNSNDLDSGLRRIADDLSTYYLLGYYSSNAKLDGKSPFDHGARETGGRQRSRPARLPRADRGGSDGGTHSGGGCRSVTRIGECRGHRIEHARPHPARRAISRACDPDARRRERTDNVDCGCRGAPFRHAGLGTRRNGDARAHRNLHETGNRHAQARRARVPDVDSARYGARHGRSPRAADQRRRDRHSIHGVDPPGPRARSAAVTAVPARTRHGEPAAAGRGFSVQPQ